MDFKEASDRLFLRVDHEELAATLGVSVASIRQARLQDQAKAKRAPPPGWQKAMLNLAERRLDHYGSLISDLRLLVVPEQGDDKRQPGYNFPKRLINIGKTRLKAAE